MLYILLQDDLIGKSVYNIIHVGDHAQFANSLLPMSVGEYAVNCNAIIHGTWEQMMNSNVLYGIKKR